MRQWKIAYRILNTYKKFKHLKICFFYLKTGLCTPLDQTTSQIPFPSLVQYGTTDSDLRQWSQSPFILSTYSYTITQYSTLYYPSTGVPSHKMTFVIDRNILKACNSCGSRKKVTVS